MAALRLKRYYRPGGLKNSKFSPNSESYKSEITVMARLFSRMVSLAFR
jgi:hypothetical protein